MDAALGTLVYLVLLLVFQCVQPLAGVGFLVYAGSKRKWKLFWSVVAVLLALYGATFACPTTRILWRQ